MIGPLFTISVHNICYAAIRAAEKSVGQLISQASAATATLATHADSGDDELCVEVRGSRGFARDIRISKAKVRSILRIEDPAATRAACQAYIDDRAVEISKAPLEAMAQDASYDDGHLEAGGGDYAVTETLTSEEQARAFAMRPSLFIGSPATLDRVLTYLQGFEAALEMAHGRQLRLHEYSDLINELNLELGNAPTSDQELQAIDSLEPILVQAYRAAPSVKESSAGSL